MEQCSRKKLQITGIVQGVGFRPTVFRYALDNNLSGFVKNTASGVDIEVEGAIRKIDIFIRTLRETPPPRARIESFHVRSIPCLEDRGGFIIISSDTAGEKKVEISPDLAACPKCIEELFEKGNRRFRYPFINCTNCGPRFTIIKDRPYDRKLTTMEPFPMCQACDVEYHDPLDRRFHAQPDACPLCGPELYLIGGQAAGDPLGTTVAQIREGKIAAVKGLGGFHIACDPFNRETLIRLRKAKNRPNKAFALMMRSLEIVERYCDVTPAERIALGSPEAPIVLLRKKSEELNSISPDNNYLGVMLPYTPLHHLLMEAFPVLLMTSANRADEPLAVTDEEAGRLPDLGIVDIILSHNREIAHRCDDSIVQFAGKRLQFIRRSRGWVPSPVVMDAGICRNATDGKPVLALGGNLKNTFSLRKGNRVYLSQHIGDLVDYRNYRYLQEQIEDLSELLEINSPEIRCDAHPGYEQYHAEYRKVYHHHAHMLSVMGEHGLLGHEVTGVICDGTGFGTDGKIWGFEFLSVNADFTRFKREGHLDYFLLPGGERAIREIDRIGAALAPGDEIPGITPPRRKELTKLIESDINCPETSSLGRLFDGVTSLLGFESRAEYEARGAILLQKAAEMFSGDPGERFPVSFSRENGGIILQYRPMVKKLIEERKSGFAAEGLAYKFHLWVAESIRRGLEILKPERVVFSGGCFQNQLLLKLLEKEMKSPGTHGIRYYHNEQVPPNDGGLSFGQGVLPPY